MTMGSRFLPLAAAAGVLCLSSTSHGTLILADHFDGQPEGWTEAQSTDLLTGEAAGTWEGSSGSLEIAAAHAHGADGKGLGFTLHTGCPSCSTQGSNLFAYDSGTYPTLFVGYWFRLSSTDWGDYDGNLKLLRFYIGDASCIPGMSLSPPRLNVFWAGEGRLHDVYAITDTDWHSYLWELQRGSPGDGDADAFDGDGVLRLWVDGVLIHEAATIDWIDQGEGLKFVGDSGGAAVINLQGNLSGNYAGPENQTIWDDFVVATTSQEATDFLGVAVGGGGAGAGGIGGGAPGGSGGFAAGGAAAGGSSSQGGTVPAQPGEPPGEDDGCGCGVVGDSQHTGTPPLWMLALGVTLGLARRRRTVP